MSPPKHNPTKPQRASSPEASRTNVSEETPYTWDKDIPTGQTLPNPDDARPIVRRPKDLRICRSAPEQAVNPLFLGRHWK